MVDAIAVKMVHHKINTKRKYEQLISLDAKPLPANTNRLYGKQGLVIAFASG